MQPITKYRCPASCYWFALLLLGACNTPLEPEKDAPKVEESSFVTDAAQTYQVEVIEDADELNTMRADIQNSTQRNPGPQESEDDPAEPTNLAEAYIQGDRKVLPELIDELKEGSTSKQQALLLSFSNWYPADAQLPTVDPRLESAIMANLQSTDTVVEVNAMAALGAIQPNGYLVALEDRLLSGQSLNPEMLVYWLGTRGNLDRTFALIQTMLLADRFNPLHNYNLVAGLAGFAENGDSLARGRVADLAVEYLKKKWLDDSFLSNEGHANEMIQLVANFGGVRHLAFLKVLLPKSQYNMRVARALVRLEGAKHKSLILSYLRNRQHFSNALDLLTSASHLGWDNRLGNYILSQFEQHGNHDDFKVDQVASALWALDQKTTLNRADLVLKDKKLANRLQGYVKLNSATLREMAQSLSDLGLLARPVAPAALERIRADHADNGSPALYALLAQTPIFCAATSDDEDEAMTVPGNEMAQVTRQYLPGLVVGTSQTEVQASEGAEDGSYHYTLQAFFQQRGYRMQLGVDAPQTKQVAALLNFVLADLGRAERWLPVGTGNYPSGYLLGDAARIEVFKEKFGLGGGQNPQTSIYIAEIK